MRERGRTTPAARTSRGHGGELNGGSTTLVVRPQPVSLGSSCDALARARAAKSEQFAASPISPESSEDPYEGRNEVEEKREEPVRSLLIAHL